MKNNFGRNVDQGSEEKMGVGKVALYSNIQERHSQNQNKSRRWERKERTRTGGDVGVKRGDFGNWGRWFCHDQRSSTDQ